MGHYLHSSSDKSEFGTLCCLGRVHCQALAGLLLNCEGF